MKGSEQIGAVEANSKPIVIQYPNTSKYAIITTKQNKQAQYHVVDMSKPGYSPTGTVGEVQSANQAMGTGTTGLYGYHYTGIEHHGSGKSMLYASRYTVSPTNSLTGTTDILAYEFTNPNSAPTEYTLHSVPGCGNTERGELQMSPYGDKLQWYRMDKNIAGYTYRTGYIYTMPLDATKTAVSGSVNIQSISAAGNLGDGQLETMGDNNTLLYAQRGLYKEGSAATKYGRNVWKYDPLSVTSLVSINPLNATSSYLYGEIKRGRDGKYYIPNMGESAVGIHSYDGGANTGSINIAQTNYSITGGLPTQVLKIYADPTQTLSEYPRYVGGKVYELKDHLGNVKVTLSDEKQIVDANSSNTIDANDDMVPTVLSYQDYYPFGQGLPGRKFTASEEYRYSYNGKEDDPENFGRQDYGMRINDKRIGKFLSVDPLSRSYPWNSPYSFALNTPIIGEDLDGAELNVKTSAWKGNNIVSKPNGDVVLYATSEKLLHAHGISLPKMSGALSKYDGGTMHYYYASSSADKPMTAVYTYYDQNEVLQTETFKANEIEMAYGSGVETAVVRQAIQHKSEEIVKEVNKIVITTAVLELGGPVVNKVLARLEKGATKSMALETDIGATVTQEANVNNEIVVAKDLAISYTQQGFETGATAELILPNGKTFIGVSDGVQPFEITEEMMGILMNAGRMGSIQAKSLPGYFGGCVEVSAIQQARAAGYSWTEIKAARLEAYRIGDNAGGIKPMCNGCLNMLEVLPEK